MRLGFREPFADEPLPSPEFVCRHHSCYDMEGWGWDSGRATGRAASSNKIQRCRNFKAEGVCPQRGSSICYLAALASFSFVTETDASLHLQTFLKKTLIQRGQRSIPGSPLAQTLGVISRGCLTLTLMTPWSTKSCLWRAPSWRLNRTSCCVFPLGLRRLGPRLHPQPAGGVSERLHGFVSVPESSRGG